MKHRQRHNGPKGRVLSTKWLTKVISQVDTNWASESRQNFSLKILTKLQSWPNLFLQNLAQYLIPKYRPNFIFKMLTKIQLQNLDQTSANIAILQIWSKQNKRITSRVLWNMRAHVFLHVRARASYTCEHMLSTRASTLLVCTCSTTI